MNTRPLVLPNVCCKCLGAPDTAYTISTSYQSSVLLDQTQVTTTTYTLPVPYCAGCAAKAKRNAVIAAALILSAAFATWYLARFLSSGIRPWLSAAAIVVALGAAPAAMEIVRPAKVTKNGLPLFDNGEYQMLFEEANGLDPDAYGIADRFARDVNVGDAQLKREKKRPPAS